MTDAEDRLMKSIARAEEILARTGDLPVVQPDKTPGDIFGTRYWNTNGIAIAVVAVYGHDNDWAAYIGAITDTERAQTAFEWTRDNGCKLWYTEALAFFPFMKESGLTYRS